MGWNKSVQAQPELAVVNYLNRRYVVRVAFLGEYNTVGNEKNEVSKEFHDGRVQSRIDHDA